MSIKNTKEGWKVDFRVGGKDGKRYRKTCKTKSEAERYQKYVESQFITTGRPWNDKPTDSRTLTDLVELWYKLCGQQLRYNESRRLKLIKTATELGNPIAHKLTASQFSHHRSRRLELGRAIKTVNDEQKYLSAVYNALRKLGEIDYENPLNGLSILKQPELEMHYLDHKQIKELLLVLHSEQIPDIELISLICLETGARWGEAERLTLNRIRNQKVTYTNTKGGKNRTIPISPELHRKLITHAKKSNTNELFQPCSSSFTEALAKTSIKLPKGQKTHVLRHTFASHFMMNGGNILTLQKILGHSSINMTLRYAHLAPDHLNDALKFNPMNGMDN